MELKILWHEGQLIKRQALVDLFSSVLWKEQGKFYLKTPVEQIEIQVEDEPLFINQVDVVEIGQQNYIQLITTHQDIVIVDAEHPIFMRVFPAARDSGNKIQRGILRDDAQTPQNQQYRYHRHEESI